MEDAEITQLKFDAAFLSSEKTLGAHVVLSVLPQRLQMEPRSAIRDMCIQMLVSKQVNLGTAMFLSWKIPEMICWLRWLNSQSKNQKQYENPKFPLGKEMMQPPIRHGLG